MMTASVYIAQLLLLLLLLVVAKAPNRLFITVAVLSHVDSEISCLLRLNIIKLISYAGNSLLATLGQGEVRVSHQHFDIRSVSHWCIIDQVTSIVINVFLN